jgi:hypothetical protein
MQSPIILEKFMMLWQSWPTSMESISIYYFFYWFHAVIKIQRCPESQWAPHDGMGHGQLETPMKITKHFHFVRISLCCP